MISPRLYIGRTNQVVYFMQVYHVQEMPWGNKWEINLRLALSHSHFIAEKTEAQRSRDLSSTLVPEHTEFCRAPHFYSVNSESTTSDTPACRKWLKKTSSSNREVSQLEMRIKRDAFGLVEKPSSRQVPCNACISCPRKQLWQVTLYGWWGSELSWCGHLWEPWQYPVLWPKPPHPVGEEPSLVFPGPAQLVFPQPD